MEKIFKKNIPAYLRTNMPNTPLDEFMKGPKVVLDEWDTHDIISEYQFWVEKAQRIMRVQADKLKDLSLIQGESYFDIDEFETEINKILKG